MLGVLERLVGRYEIASDRADGAMVEWAKLVGGWSLELVRSRRAHTFQVLPRRWVVETFGWFNLQRRLKRLRIVRNHRLAVHRSGLILRDSLAVLVLRVRSSATFPYSKGRRRRHPRTRDQCHRKEYLEWIEAFVFAFHGREIAAQLVRMFPSSNFVLDQADELVSLRYEHDVYAVAFGGNLDVV